ncbi:hypothetical protein E4U41_002720 [Claviceps citrina]|nr:hypothetical protein E4U41_002720 [Claviceps citrina]
MGDDDGCRGAGITGLGWTGLRGPAAGTWDPVGESLSVLIAPVRTDHSDQQLIALSTGDSAGVWGRSPESFPRPTGDGPQ